MSFILIPNNGDDAQVNAWNWRPTLEFLRAQTIITSEQAKLLGCNGCGARVDADMANQIAAAIENKLSTMAPGDRMRADLTVTSVPKAPQVFRPSPRPGDIDDNELYSATYEWLVTFKDFCKRCDGFMVSQCCGRPPNNSLARRMGTNQLPFQGKIFNDSMRGKCN